MNCRSCYEASILASVSYCAFADIRLCKNAATGRPPGAFNMTSLNNRLANELYRLITLKRGSSKRDRFEVLMQEHFEALYSAARRMTRSLHDAEDLVQEVCITAFSRVDELERMEFRRAWLLKVMYNRFIDGQRSSRRSAVDIAPTGEETEDPDTSATSVVGPDELVDRDQNVQRVLRAMRCLSADGCALVAMHDVEGFSIEELCQLTGKPAGTIKAQLHRTRAKLGRLLSSDSLARPKLKLIGGKR